MALREYGEGKYIAKGIVPIPVREDVESGLVAAMKPDSRSNVFKTWNGAVFTDRDGGLFDNLNPVLSWAPKISARKDIYDFLRLRGSSISPYHGMVSALDIHADLTITGLLVEVADRPSQYSLSLGAAVMVTRKSRADNWCLSLSNLKLINDARGSNEAKLINCGMDELLGLAFVTKLPIVIAESLYGSVSMDGLMEKEREVTMTAPMFESERDAADWRQQMAVQRQQDLSKTELKAKKPGDVKDASAYLHMSVAEKRALLRASGLSQLPRPREGSKAVDALLIPLIDEEVAYEVLRRLAETGGDFEQAAEMEDFQSRKPQLARRIKEARNAGDLRLARKLCDELNGLAMLRWDPTMVGADSAGAWDVEDWYWEQRKRVYGIIAA